MLLICSFHKDDLRFKEDFHVILTSQAHLSLDRIFEAQEEETEYFVSTDPAGNTILAYLAFRLPLCSEKQRKKEKEKAPMYY
jgi:hypothetical protein